jgi:nucleoside-diphosphate-sugar epimerase
MVDCAPAPHAAQDWIVGANDRILVTGANGFIGARVIRALLERGFRRIRCFVRPSSNRARLQDILQRHECNDAAVEIIEGNLLSREDAAKAMVDVPVVLHLAAGIDKSFAGCFMNSVLTTRNLLDAAIETGAVKRFVNVSSFAVYSTLRLPRGAVVDETTPVETHPQQRFDPYGYAKLKQEQLVREYSSRAGVPYVILRPGAVFGPGNRSLSGRVGINTFGIFLHMGGSNRVPLTYVDNCANAVVLAGLVPGIDGEVFNVVDDDLPTSRRFLWLYKRHAGWFPSVPVPYTVGYVMSSLWERLSSRSKGQLPPRFNRRRAAAEWKRHRYSNAKLKLMMGWTPEVPFDRAARLFLDSLASRS